MNTACGASISLAVKRLRHSSSLRPSVIAATGRPVEGRRTAATSKLAPVPGDGFSITYSGVALGII